MLDLLQNDVGVANLAVLPGCSIKPPGDLVLADLARESADGVIRALREQGIDVVGTIALDSVDTSVSRAAERAEDGVPGDGSDAVIWEQVIRSTDAQSALSATFIAFLAIATVLACAFIAGVAGVLSLTASSPGRWWGCSSP